MPKKRRKYDALKGSRELRQFREWLVRILDEARLLPVLLRCLNFSCSKLPVDG